MRRETNKVADLVAKSSLSSRIDLLFYDSIVNLPFCFINHLWVDCMVVNICNFSNKWFFCGIILISFAKKKDSSSPPL